MKNIKLYYRYMTQALLKLEKAHCYHQNNPMKYDYKNELQNNHDPKYNK